MPVPIVGRQDAVVEMPRRGQDDYVRFLVVMLEILGFGILRTWGAAVRRFYEGVGELETHPSRKALGVGHSADSTKNIG